MERKIAKRTDSSSTLGRQPLPPSPPIRPIVPRDVNSILSIAFGVVAFTVLLVYSMRATAPYVVGENLVRAEIALPGFFIKPITLFTYLFFASFAFGLNSPVSRARFLRMDERLFEGIYITAWFLVMMSGFEVMYQIVLWSAGLAVQGLQNPDIIVNWWPLNPYAINVVFAAKLVVLIFAISCFTVDYLRRMRTAREKVRESTNP